VQHNLKLNSLTGLLVASTIVLLWISSLIICLSTPFPEIPLLWILPIALGRTFIQTGLFIVAHDAIHASAVPGNHRLNHWIGQITVTLYALLPYRKLSLNHWQHHRRPGQLDDPDFHDGVNQNIVSWYLKFMKGYLDTRQKIILLFGMGSIFFTLQLGFQADSSSLLTFWVLPIILSSMQLFFFGTYLPHRTIRDEIHADSHQATSSNYSLFWSFLTCYHFGYHWEHHQYPSLPWYCLPAVRQTKPQEHFNVRAKNEIISAPQF
jgi:beta-carotene/zeaxanthin 4-ketolase